MSQPREIYFHEDDYCQQQLLPREAAEHAQAELEKIREFSKAHRDPAGLGWTDMYIRRDGPVELRGLKISQQEIAAIVSAHLPPFGAIYTGYSTYRELCRRAAAWGRSQQCALLADWGSEGIVASIWTEFFDRGEEAILAGATAVAALGARYPLVYVDWAWGYLCEASDPGRFASLLRSKLDAIAENLKR